MYIHIHIYIYIYSPILKTGFHQFPISISLTVYIYPTSLPWSGCDTIQFFKRIIVDLNSESSLSYITCFTMIKGPSLPKGIPIAGETDGFMSFTTVLASRETQSAWMYLSLYLSYQDTPINRCIFISVYLSWSIHIYLSNLEGWKSSRCSVLPAGRWHLYIVLSRDLDINGHFYNKPILFYVNNSLSFWALNFYLSIEKAWIHFFLCYG